MRILFLTPWFPAHREDQHGNFILDSVESLVEIGHELTVLVSEPWRPRMAGLINKNWKRKNIKVEQYSNQFNLHFCHYLSIPRSRFCSFSHWSFRREINPFLEKLIFKYECQLIHAHTELPGIAAIDVGRKLNIPIVITMHGISTEKRLYHGKTRKRLFEYTLSNADRVVVVGKPLLSFSQKFVNNLDHFRIVGNGFRSNKNYSKNTEKKEFMNPLRFISVSNLEEGKGIDINLYAFAKLNEDGMRQWTYQIIGDGSERKNLQKLMVKLNLIDQVMFLGSYDHDQVYRHLINADVFILPSYREAFGIAYLEAMSYGLLTIAVKGQGPEVFIEHEKTGLLVEPKNINALYNIIKNIFVSSKSMIEISNNAKKHANQYFTWKMHAKNLEKVYQELI